MTTTKHKITAYRSGTIRGVDFEEEWEISFLYTPPGGDGWNEPAHGATIEFDRLLGQVDAPEFARELAEQHMNDWAEDWLAEHEAEAIAAAVHDLEAAADDYADFKRRQRIDDRITGDR